MAKTLKTAEEIEALLMQAAAKSSHCAGLTGLTIRSRKDDGLPYSWDLATLHNSPGTLCDVYIATAVDGAQRVIDLKE